MGRIKSLTMGFSRNTHGWSLFNGEEEIAELGMDVGEGTTRRELVEEILDRVNCSKKCTSCTAFYKGTSNWGQKVSGCSVLRVSFKDISQDPGKFSCANWSKK
jgi:hypothetical protein